MARCRACTGSETAWRRGSLPRSCSTATGWRGRSTSRIRRWRCPTCGSGRCRIRPRRRPRRRRRRRCRSACSHGRGGGGRSGGGRGGGGGGAPPRGGGGGGGGGGG